MLVLTPKYGSQIDLDLLKKTKEQLITHRKTIDLNQCKDIKEAYLTFLDNTDKYVIGYKPKDSKEINWFVKSLGSISALDVSWIDVSDLYSLSDCFKYCSISKITGLDKWDVSHVKNMFSLFVDCHRLNTIDGISNWDVSNVENMAFMFVRSWRLRKIGDISEWMVSNCMTMFGMFYECKNLNDVGDLNKWVVNQKLTCHGMFQTCMINKPDWYNDK